MTMQIEAARQLVYHAASLKDAGHPYGKEAAMAKTFASDMAVKVALMQYRLWLFACDS